MTARLDGGGAMVVDARGHRCPTPTLRLRRALEAAPAGATVVLLADDPMARIDVPHFAAQGPCTLLDVEDDAGGLRFTLRKDASADAGGRG